jgi:predicted O-methyltransferase YrrM
MEFLPTNIEDYAKNYSEKESNLLNELNRDTNLNVLQPRMLSGHMQGRILSMFSKMIQPKCILEVGTYTGYAALCMAEGLDKNGELHTIDINEELAGKIKSYFNQSDKSEQLHLHIGNALDIIPNLNISPDLTFIDADKENYLNYYKLIIENLKPGAIIIGDNVLWSGKVTDEQERNNDTETKALHEFNEFVHADERVENVLFPVRDGLMVLRKK